MYGKAEVRDDDVVVVTVSRGQKETVATFPPISAGTRLVIEIDEDLRVTPFLTNDPFDVLNGSWLEADEE